MKHKYWVVIIPLVLVGSLAMFSLHSFVTAQQAGQGLEVSPPSQEVSIDPGGNATVTATLRNRSNNELPITVRVEDFTAKGDQGQIELQADSPYSVTSWTEVSPSEFTLAPGEEQEVTATLNAPEDAAGGRFGSFVFSVNADAGEGTAASVAQEIASLFLVKVSGTVDEQLTLNSFNAPQFSEYGPIQFALNFSNSGNVHTKTFGLINVTDMFGNKVEDVVVQGTNIFPGADRTLTASLDKQFLFGKYTADALVYYGGENESLNASTTFYVFPYKIAAIILIVIIALVLMRKRLGKAGKALRGK